MSLENKASDYERIISEDRTIHNDNLQRRDVKRKPRILPIVLTALISAGVIGSVGYVSINDIVKVKKAEQTYSQIEAKYVPHEKDGTVLQIERENFLYRVIKGKAFVRNPGELPVYADGRVVPIEDLAKMAVEYSSKH